jgi:succinate dehydrogenase / fumarate reductase cytochrome b subunit
VSTLVPANTPASNVSASLNEAAAGGPKKAKNYGTPPGRFHFMIRRLHSATGLVFGGYIVAHLLVNATGLSPAMYQGNVDHIHSLEPMLWLVELTVIFIPLLIHMLYGIYIVKAGVKFNSTKYPYGGNIRYTLQRWTAVILLLFIAFHVGTMHKWGLAGIRDITEKVHPLPVNANGLVDVGRFDALNKFSAWCDRWGGQFQAGEGQAFTTTAMGIRRYFYDAASPGHIGALNWAVIGFYLLGIWSACFHLANGLWTSAIAWGLTVTRNSQRRWGHVCLFVGIVVTILGTIAWYAFTFAPDAVAVASPGA